MPEVTTFHEVWDGTGKFHLRTQDRQEVYKLVDKLSAEDNLYSKIHSSNEWACTCGEPVVSHGGRDTICFECKAQYNGSGQRITDRFNLSMNDENISDLDGYEMSMAGDE